MIAYEFYVRNEANEVNLVGILPERRKDLARITHESVMNWLKIVLGEVENIDKNNVYFIQTEI